MRGRGRRGVTLKGHTSDVLDDKCVSDIGLRVASLPHAVYYKSAGYGWKPTQHGKYFIQAEPASRFHLREIEVWSTLKTPKPSRDLLPRARDAHDARDRKGCALSAYSRGATPKIPLPWMNTIMKSLNEVASIEGTLTGTLSFQPARIIDLVIYALFVLYYMMLLISELVPQSSWSRACRP